MIVSQSKIKNDVWCLIHTSDYFREDEMDISLMIVGEEIKNPHEINYWDDLDLLSFHDLKGYHGENGCLTPKILPEYQADGRYYPQYGDNVNALTMTDTKLVKSLVCDVVRWALSIGNKVSFSPVDMRRLKATEFLLRRDFEYVVNIKVDEYNDETILLEIKGEK